MEIGAVVNIYLKTISGRI